MANPSKLFVNVSGVTISPPSPASAITVTKVTDVDWQRGGKPLQFYGDGAGIPTMIVTVERQRTVTIMGGDKGVLASVPENTPCTVAWVEQDARNGTGVGSRTYTLANAVLVSNPHKGQENQFGSASLQFVAYSTDGTTDPLSEVTA